MSTDQTKPTKTVFCTYDSSQQRHFITSAIDGGTHYDHQLPGSLWDTARVAIKYALIAGEKLTNRGEFFDYGGVRIIVELVR